MSLAKPSTRERETDRRASAGGDTPFQSAFPMIESKFACPPLRPGMVQRERLLRQLVDSELAIVSMVAPPGYGKTTLLAQWAAAQDGPVAWLTIDASDNDPVVLMTYLGAAIDRVRRISAETAKSLSTSSRRVLESAVPHVISELHAWQKPGLIVIDDAHLLTDRMGLDALSTLIDHLPASFQMAIAGRYRPTLPFARLAAHRRLVELGREELALDTMETSELVAAAGQTLSADEIGALSARTEGWAVGIYLATVALGRGRQDFGPMSSFSGTDPNVAAYLRSEFEDDLEPDDMTFLTRSVVLERISPRVAEVVTDTSDAGGRLRRLARRSQLVQELPGLEPTYRYHNLLRDFLAVELEAREPGGARTMNRRAAVWFHGAEETDLAIEHALAGEDFDAAARFVTAAAYPTHQRGRTSTLERWLAAFDDDVYAKHPPLAVIAAWSMMLTGRGDDADAFADIAERAEHHGAPGDGSASFASQRAMLRAAMTRSGPRDALDSARIGVALERPGSPWRSTALMLAGFVYEMLDQPDEADLAYAEAIGTGAASSSATVMTSFAKRAQLRMNAGDWASAQDFIGRADELRELWQFEGIVNVLFVHSISARIAIQRGDFEAGRAALVRAQLLRPLANHAAPSLSVDALLNLSRAYLAFSDPAGAQLALREAENIVRRRPALGSLTTQLVEVRARLADATATLIGSSALTAAELRVLPFLPTYLSFQEIAERLMISRNTVKTHAMSIYGKLWASSRGEAVERAVEMGLLEPYPALNRPVAQRNVSANGNSLAFLRVLGDEDMDGEARPAD